jgi:hypothetical protein
MLTPKNRREVLQTLGAAGALLIACDDGGSSTSPKDAGTLDAHTPDTSVDMQAPDAQVDSAVDAAPMDAVPVDQAVDMTPPLEGWAAGGTAARRDPAQYPDPFAMGLGAMCTLVGTTTAGPCTTAIDYDRVDISEGWTGLPMRIALKIVDSACQPLVGALVRVWHTNVEGSYSGDTPRNDFCLLNPEHQQFDFFRGVQTTDADGVVYFDSCFPGWYPGRAIHIHFEIEQNGRSTRISQLTFPNAIINEVFAEHPDYVAFGPPDTPLAADGIFEDLGDLAPLTFDVARMPDGWMLASKAVVVV